jgi:hypothetical protein
LSRPEHAGFLDTSTKMMAEFNPFTRQVGDALPVLEQKVHEVTSVH